VIKNSYVSLQSNRCSIFIVVWPDFQEPKIIYEGKKGKSLKQTLWMMGSFRKSGAWRCNLS